MKQFKIGRNKSNDIVISAPDVSGTHAIVTKLSKNVYLIEDLNSTNGTFINGQRVRRTTFTFKDNIMLARTPLEMNLLLEKPEAINKASQEQKAVQKPKPIEKPKPEKKQSKTSPKTNKIIENNDYSEEFKKLEIVYKAYIDSKNHLQKRQSWMTAGVRVVGSIAGALAGFGVLGIGASIIASNFLKDPEKMNVLNEEFKIHYVCPKCKRFLGNIPYEGLVNMKKHGPPCNAIWVKD